MHVRGLIFAAVIGLTAGMASAQDAQTLADIRQELTVLNVEIQRLKRELSTTGAPTSSQASGSVLDRVDTIEASLQRLTRQTEQMNQRIERIVADGTNRIGDLEFRLVELEGGDVSTLGETSTLGGDTGSTPVIPVTPSQPDDTELAVGEKAEFDAAKAALDAGEYRKAADLLNNFDASYPGSPLAPAAHLNRGKALDGLGDTREAARAYLASFTNDSTGPVAPDALYELGAALGRLGQVDQACVTLAEVGVRFPSAAAVSNAQQEMTSLGCS
ncbi:tol-pal system protein YbgF [Tropicibacter sp. R16_0]|uniref:tol-pal system protein YbgF n=1 Tax=Tropicibacter sp. R16_0 TaxID=2821102 RepID=UPI001AD9A052|nr:tol-pal system protein YbgF [Tropicibacter sp. R16_0]MBO9451579.1 tol-pal system protein YbgF [Tropicibacter sp. R16_0]